MAKFKSPLYKRFDLIFIGSIFLLSLISLVIFDFKLNSFHPILIIVFSFLSYYALRYALSCETTIEVMDDILTINQCNSTFDISIAIDIHLNEVRGYEINQVTKGSTALFIYTNSFSYYKFSLMRTKDELTIQNYLGTFIKKLDSKTNPLFSSFLTAYLFAFKRSIIYIILSATAIAGLFFIVERQTIWPSNKFVFPFLSFIISTALWYIIIRIPVKRNYFRFGAFYWFSNFLFYTSMFVMYPLLIKITEIRENPITFNHPYEMLKSKHSGLFLIKKVSYNPNLILLYDYQENPNVKGKSFPVTHHFLTPLGSGDSIKTNGLYNLWLFKTYEQYVKKSLMEQTKREEIFNFHIQSKQEFIESLNTQPNFYTLVEQDDRINWLLNPSSNFSKSGIIIEPHWETMSEYKRALQKQMLFLILAIVMMNLVGCIFIAIHR